MKQLFEKLFCNHEYEEIYRLDDKVGEETIGLKAVRECSKCGKHKIIIL